MPIITSYICDKCHEPISVATDLWQIEVLMRKLVDGRIQMNHRPLVSQGTGTTYVYWCTQCVDKSELVKPADPAGATPITLEEIVEEIAREVAENVMSEGP